MRAHRAKVAALVTALALSACARGEPELLNLRAPGRGPDEFAILPTEPLQEPPSYEALPAPTPGGRNITDPTPRADAIAALGGTAGAGPGAGALVAHATRFGTAPDIRARLAAEDLAFRRRNDGRLLERLFDVTVYFDAYRPLSLDQYRELERFRAAGVRTPAAPPDPAR